MSKFDDLSRRHGRPPGSTTTSHAPKPTTTSYGSVDRNRYAPSRGSWEYFNQQASQPMTKSQPRTNTTTWGNKPKTQQWGQPNRNHQHPRPVDDSFLPYQQLETMPRYAYYPTQRVDASGAIKRVLQFPSFRQVMIELGWFVLERILKAIGESLALFFSHRRFSAGPR
jgi:hypothetical protein